MIDCHELNAIHPVCYRWFFQNCNSANAALYRCGYAKQSDLFNQGNRWRERWQCVRSATMAKTMQIVWKLVNAMKCSHFYVQLVVILLIGHSKRIKQVGYDDIMMVLCAITGLLWSKSMRMTRKTTKMNNKAVTPKGSKYSNPAKIRNQLSPLRSPLIQGPREIFRVIQTPKANSQKPAKLVFADKLRRNDPQSILSYSIQMIDDIIYQSQQSAILTSLRNP